MSTRLKIDPKNRKIIQNKSLFKLTFLLYDKQKYHWTLRQPFSFLIFVQQKLGFTDIGVAEKLIMVGNFATMALIYLVIVETSILRTVLGKFWANMMRLAKC